MKHIRRRDILRFAAGASAGAFASPVIFRHAAFGAESPVLVGSLHDQSGPLAGLGVPMTQCLTLAVDELNAAGGLLGRPVQLVHYDTQSNIQLYSQYAQQLALKDKVSVVHGGITSASREAIRPTFDRYKTLYFYNTLYEGGLCDRNIFCTGTTPAQTVEKLVPYTMNKWGKKAYIIAADYNYGQITAKWMTKYLVENGGQVLSTDFFPLDVTNFGPTISKIQAAKPDFILSVLVGSNHTSFYRQWAAAGMKADIPIASTTFGLINETNTQEAAVTEGIVGAYGYLEELATPASRTFIKKLKDKFGAEIPYITELAACTYEGFWMWAEGVKKAGTLDRMKVIEAIEGGLEYDGPTGHVALDRQTHHATRNAFLGQVKDKAWTILQTFENQKPLDTAGVCNLIDRPNDQQQYIVKI